MRRASLLIACAAVALAAEPPATLVAPRARADFELTADPAAPHWKKVKPTRADIDPFGKPAGPSSFEYRILWTDRNLYFLFTCPYDALNLKPSPSASVETNKLWEWDVTEVFIGADLSNIQRYREFQVSPQSEWVDLDIDRKNPNPEGWKWDSGMKVKGRIDEAKKIWYGEMMIPIRSIDDRPAKRGNQMRMNIYRLSGKTPNRRSTMWLPTNARSHHTPEAFGLLKLGR